MIPRTARRGFALLAAIGVLAVLGLIIAAFGDSVMAHRQISSRWKTVTDERLAETWVLGELRQMDTANLPTSITESYGEIELQAELAGLDLNSPIYAHPALAHRAGDLLATVTIGDTVHHFLLRSEPSAVHHRLPENLIPDEETTP